jgi:O-antigen/teichoic acid export membrane protein
MQAKKQPSIEHRIAKVSAVTGFSTVLSIGMQLVSVPVCLRYWGNDTYGTWLALFAAFTLLRTVDGGYIGFVGNKLNMLYHKDEQKLKLTLASAVWGVVILGVLQLMILGVLYVTDSMSLIMGIQHNSASTRDAVLSLLVLSVSWIFSGSYIGIVHRFLIPAGLMYQAAWWGMGFQVTQFVALMTAAVLRFDILQATVLFALIQATIYIASAIYIKVKLPRYYPWWVAPSRKVGVFDLLQSLPFTLSGVLQQAGNSGLTMAVGGILGASAIPAFSTARTLSNLWTSVINIITTPLLPDVVRFYEKGEGRKLLAVHQAHGLLISLIVNFSILIAYPFLERAYGIWTNNHLLLNKSLLSLLLATVSLSGMTALMNSFLSGINQLSFVTTIATLRGGLALLLSLFLIPIYQVTGVGIAVFLAEIFVLIITVFWFFKPALAKIATQTKWSVLGWSWLPVCCVVIYLLAECFTFVFSNVVYWTSLGGVLFGNLLVWHGLDVDIKTRVKLLFLFK